jgi:hypothetical protein
MISFQIKVSLAQNFDLRNVVLNNILQSPWSEIKELTNPEALTVLEN